MGSVVHRRQFCISVKRFEREDWRYIDLPDGYVLSYHGDLEVSVMPASIAGQRRILIGSAFSIIAHSADLEDLSGKFVWIDWPVVRTDASAMLAIYYGKVDGTTCISSSPAIAAAMCRSPHFIADASHWGRGVNWIPSPGCKAIGISRLMRDQQLNVLTGDLEYTPRKIEPLASFQQARDQLAQGLVNVLGEISRRHEKVYLALTSGLDSRTLLSAMLAGGIKFELVTQVYPRVSRSDIAVPSKIGSYLGIKHHVVELEERDSKAVEILRNHSLGAVDDADQHFLFAGNSYRYLQRGQALVRGGAFELGRRYFERRLGDMSFQQATGEEICARFNREHIDPDFVRNFDKWLDWRRPRNNGLDLTDGFYLDQRLGGWLSALEQGVDLLHGACVQPVNSSRFFAALITPTYEQRRSGLLQIETIRYLNKGLLQFPINPKSWRKSASEIAGKMKRRFRSFLR